MGINPDPWRHSFDPENYRPLIEFDVVQHEMHAIMLRHGFLKLHRFLPLENWSQIQAFSEDTFSELVRALQKSQSKT